MSYRIGIDIGGTFTDVAVVRADGSTLLWKEETTPDRLDEAIERGLRAVAEQLGLDLRSLLADASPLVHGSTVATNTLIQRDGPRIGLVCTRGFRDVLLFRDGFKPNRFDLHVARPTELAERWLRVGVAERLDRTGAVVKPLDEGSILKAAQKLRQGEVDAVAVALLWAHANPAHERRVRDVLDEELPGVPVLLSSDVLPELGEWTRTAATAVSAYVYPRSAEYLRRLERKLGRELLVMQVNGGCARIERALEAPVNLVASGPAAGPVGALRHAERIGTRDLIAVDMGGTSFEVCLVEHGELPRSRTLSVGGSPLGVPGIEVHSIGAGGGSLAWIDSGGALRVGPQSAGARPGPAAYAAGGRLPTVTDANVVLGYLSPESFLGGRRPLSHELASAAITAHVANPLKVDVVEAAAGVIRVVNENMVGAIRAVSVERGIDPRRFILVAGGGAGALHACRLAAELEIDRVLVPKEAGALSAFGMTASDVRHDYSGALETSSDAPVVAEVADLVASLEARAIADLERSGFPRERIRLSRFVDARYTGQVHELITPVPGGTLDAVAFQTIADEFARLHEDRYTYALPETRIQYLHWRVSAFGTINGAAAPAAPSAPHAAPQVIATPTGVREAWFEETGGFVETPVHVAEALVAGQQVEAPAIIDGATTTIVLMPGWHLEALTDGGCLLQGGIGV